MKKGLVLSDFHTLAPYSAADKDWPRAEEELRDKDICVLNGDLFEGMRNVPRKPLAEIAAYATAKLTALMEKFPRCTFHCVIGNHERYTEYVNAMRKLASQYPDQFKLYGYGMDSAKYCKLGDAIFLHGDQHIFPQYYQKDPYARPLHERHQPLLSQAFNAAANVIVPRFAHYIPRYKPNRTMANILKTLGQDPGGMPEGTHHIFYGDSHTPFTYRQLDGVDGIYFHNTGASIKTDKARLNMLRFELDDNNPAFPKGKITSIAPCLDKSDLKKFWAEMDQDPTRNRRFGR